MESQKEGHEDCCPLKGGPVLILGSLSNRSHDDAYAATDDDGDGNGGDDDDDDRHRISCLSSPSATRFVRLSGYLKQCYPWPRHFAGLPVLSCIPQVYHNCTILCLKTSTL